MTRAGSRPFGRGRIGQPWIFFISMLGTRLSDRYELTAEIGRGGMGVVYRARDPLLDREVAIKLIPPLRLGSENEERFQREAQVVAQLDHPAIVPIHDYGRHEGSLFFVMPLVPGTTLRSLIDQRKVSLGDTVEIGIRVAEALDYSHARGVIHRDVKPENIMASRETGSLRLRVMDFGLAHDLSRSQRLTLPEGLLVGTPAYLSPEQVKGRRLDLRSDLYSLGVVLYECLAGEPPFSGPIHETIARITNESPLPLRDRGLDVDPGLERIVLCCLAKRPSDRPASGRELAGALLSYGHRLDHKRRAQVVAVRAGRPAQRVGPPLVGRDEEIQQLLECLATAESGECQLVVVAGEAGTGKTRLLQELEDRLRKRPVLVLRGRFADREGASPYQGICDLITDFFRNRDIDERSLEVSDLAADLLTLFPVLSEIEILRRAAGNGQVTLSPSARNPSSSHLFELLSRTLTRLTDGRPAVLLLENLHRGEASIEALQYIVRRLGPTPTLIAGSYRPSEVDKAHPLNRFLESFRDDPRCHELILRPLDMSAFRQLVESLVGSSELRDDLVDGLFEATEGNPFFAQELIRSLNESGEIQRDESGDWVIAGEMQQVTRALPITMHQAIEKRIERLPAHLQRLLSTASVLGKRFDLQDLEAVTSGSTQAGQLEDDIDALIDHGILTEERKSRGGLLCFTSGIVRDVLYGELPRRRRRNLHRRCGQHLERRYEHRLERVYSQLVYHYYEGDVSDKTVFYAGLLARTLVEAWSPEDAIRTCKKALEFVEEGEVPDALRHQGELWLVVARAHRALGQISSALMRAEKSLASFTEAKATGSAAEVALFAAQTAWQARRVGETRKWVFRAASLPREEVPPGILEELFTLASTLANLRGEYEEARRLRMEAESLARDEETEPAQPPLRSGGRLVTVVPSPIASLDPGRTQTDWEIEIGATLFETLLICDAKGRLAPSLCAGWDAQEGAARFRLDLQPDVRFSDGRRLTPSGVKQSLELAARRRGRKPPAALFDIVGMSAFLSGDAEGVEGIEAFEEEGYLLFHLTQSLPIFPGLLTDPGIAIALPGSSADESASKLVGTGPFRLAAREREGSILLERNPDDWRGRPALLDEIEFRTDLDASGIAAGLRSGEIDLGRDLAPEELEEVLRVPPYPSALRETTKKNVYLVLFNHSRPEPSRIALRRAMTGVVRTHDLVWRTLGRFAQPAVGLIPPGLLGHDPGRRPTNLDRNTARSLLDEAGGPPEHPLRAAVHPLLQDRYGSLTRVLFEDWATLGIEVENVTPSAESFLLASASNQDIDLLIGRWNADYDDPDNFTHYLFHSRDGFWRHYYCSAEGDGLLERARQEPHPAARQHLYGRFEDLLASHRSVFPLFHDIDYRVANPTVRGLELTSTPPYVNYREIGKVDSEVELQGPALPLGEIHVPISAHLSSLDPVKTHMLEYAEVIPNVFETLAGIDEDSRIVPRLARKIQALEGGGKYYLQLRHDLHFHDGRRLTARDVRYSFERVLRIGGSALPRLPIAGAGALRRGEATELAGLEILSSSELTIELEEPLSFFPALLVHPGFAVVPEGCERFDGRWRDGCVGTGPFRIVGFEPGVRLDLERNPLYRRREHPKCGRLVFHCDLDPEAILDQFREGHLSLASDLRPEDVESLRRNPAFADGYREAPRLATYFLALNAHRGPFRDSGLRRAFAASLDVAERLHGPQVGRLVSADGLLPPGLPGHEPPRSPVVPAKIGAEILRGVRLQIAVNPSYAGLYGNLWSGLTRTFQRLGLVVEVEVTPPGDLIAVARRGQVDLIAQRWIADYPDSDNFMMGLLHSEQGMLGTFCGDAEIDHLLRQGRRETDPTLRHTISRERDDRLARDAFLVPLFHEQTYRFAAPKLRGLRVGLSLPEVRYEELFWES